LSNYNKNKKNEKSILKQVDILKEFQRGIYQIGKLVSQVDEKNFSFFYPQTFLGFVVTKVWFI
jgi:hypothetical protein